MANFIVIPLSTDKENLNKLISEKFGNACFCLPNGDWLISYTGTSKQLSEDLNITDGGNGGNAVILNFHGYWGLANNDIWEWLSEYSR